MKEVHGKYNKACIFTDVVDDKSIEQEHPISNR